MLIDCDTCAVRGDACGDCVVHLLLASGPDDMRPAGPGDIAWDEVVSGDVDWDEAEQQALRALADGGLIPPVVPRLVPHLRPGPGLLPVAPVAPVPSRPAHGVRPRGRTRKAG